MWISLGTWLSRLLLNEEFQKALNRRAAKMRGASKRRLSPSRPAIEGLLLRRAPRSRPRHRNRPPPQQQLRPPPNPQLLKHMLQMNLHRLLADTERPGNLLVGVTRHTLLHDPVLLRR